ncbi:uncharacterized protein LOC131642290 [Vicia villosa]|uniref:uncharacterized protein LOC131642290 n=1 Tax=Vicia villosa TaxID=3911 RepID=UPI00273CE0B8|nr:uncharacterized protein LOC131642290 [Vicia villosa]
MLPIAFAVVEGENRDSWTWFLELLIDDLGGKNECLTYTFMSDQQKGLLPAMDELLPNVEQRFCVRHLYNNFRKRYPGKMLKEIIWRAAKATYAQAWEREMKRMRLINEEAYLHMMKTPPRFWSRSYFRGTNKCNVVVNNLSESFNSVILEARSKPLVTMVEEIRTYCMEKWATNRMRFQKLADDDVLPNIRKKVDRTSTYTNSWIVRMSAEHIFEVHHVENHADKFVVNLKECVCTCRRWELTGLPCVHALASIKSRNFKVEEYIPAYYRKSMYMKVYSSIIYPLNGSNLWARTEYPDVLPPKYRRMPGRPKKRRNLEQGEIDGSDKKMRRVGLAIRCSRCKKPGHNKTTCKITQSTQGTQQNTQATQPTQPATQPVSQPAVNLSQSVSQPAVNLSQPASAQGSKTSTQPSKKSTQPSKKTTTRPAKLGVRRPTTPFVPPGPTTRLSAAKNMIGPTTRRTTPTKRTTPKKKN